MRGIGIFINRKHLTDSLMSADICVHSGEGAAARPPLTALNSSLASLARDDSDQRRKGHRANFHTEKQDRKSRTTARKYAKFPRVTKPTSLVSEQWIKNADTPHNRTHHRSKVCKHQTSDGEATADTDILTFNDYAWCFLAPELACRATRTLTDLLYLITNT